MKMSKRILSSILAILMVVSVCSVGFTVSAADEPSGSILDPIVLEPIARPVVDFSCTEVTRVAKAVNSVEPGETIVKATPSGVPELSGTYASQAYAGETPVATRVTFSSPTVGIQVNEISCNNESVVLSPLQYSNGTYYAEIQSGTVARNEDGTYNPIIFTVNYTWTDGNQYQEKCVSYVDGIATGGSYVEAQSEIKALSGSGSYYRLWASASTRLLGKGVFYEQPATITTSDSDPYRQYGVYNVATGEQIVNVSAGYNTLLFADDKSDSPAGKHNQANELSVPGATVAHVYVDSSEADTLDDINLRLDANVGLLSDRNNSNPYTALADAWVSSGSNVDTLVTTNDATAQAAIGLDIPAKQDYGVTQFQQNASMTTITKGVGQYGHLFTSVLNGKVANLVDGSSYTITTKYYSYMWVKKGLLQHYNMTSAATVPTSITFHIVDKGALREMIDYVMNTDPDVPTTRAKTKGVNPQAWYYANGFTSFQNAYVEAINVLNNPRADQSAIDAKTKALDNAYKSLTLKGADYKEVNTLKTQAQAIKKNAAAYHADDIALIDEALAGVKTGYNILYQGAVDTMAKNLQTAINNAEPLPADYSVIDNAKELFDTYNEADYDPTTWEAVEDAFAAVVRGKSALEQKEVDAMAKVVLDAMDALILIADLANWDALDAAIKRASLISDLSVYQNGAAVTAAVKAANNAKADNEKTPWTVDRQGEVDSLTKAINDAIDNLKYYDADKTELYKAINKVIPGNRACYNQDILSDYDALIVAGTAMYNNANLTIKDQASIDSKVAEINAAYQQLMNSLDHAEGDAVVENNVAPDCTNTGSYDEVVYCSNCGEEISRKTITVNALGHTEGEAVIENEKEADCETDGGYDTVVYCTVCGEEVSRETTVFKALGHTEGEAVIENESDADCETDGGYDTVVYCTVCGKEVSRETTVTGALGHTAGEAVEENRTEADCTNDGSYDTVTYCTVCGKEVSRKTTVIKALGHTEGEAVEENRTEADCTNDGSYDKVVYCTVCDAEVSRETIVIKALGHTAGEAVEENRTEADCTNDGSYDTVVYCTVCGEEVSRETTVIDALGHTEGEWVVTKENGVFIEGEETLYCTVCGEVLDTRVIPAITAYFKEAEGKDTIIDKERGIIYGLDFGITDLEGYVDYVGGELQYEYVALPSGDSFFGTGTVVNFVVNGEVLESYTVIIFGDVYSDGVVDTYDVAVVSAYVNGDDSLLEEGSAQFLAADVYGDGGIPDGTVDTYDLAVIMAYVNGDTPITQTPEI